MKSITRGRIARILGVVALVAVMVPCLSGCAWFDSWKSDTKGTLSGLAFTMTAYDNSGNETLTAHGTKVGLASNRVKDGTDSDGNSTYSDSAVITITIDGKEIESCGDTLVFAEDGLTPVKDYSAEMLQIESSSRDSDLTSNTLVAKPLNDLRNLFGKERVVVIKSQLGNPIEVYQGDSVYWEVRDDLPKTTKLEIDGKALYIHRANFQIIDANLLSE